MQESFGAHVEALVTSSELVIERPRGSAIDVWRGSLAQGHLDAVVCTVDLEKRGAEVKLLLGCTPAEKQIICAFHRSAWTAALLVERRPLSTPVPLEE